MITKPSIDEGHAFDWGRTSLDYAVYRPGGTGSVSCNSAFVLHLCRFLNQEELMERKVMVQNP